MTKRNILVVGGSSGIGFALVETLLAQGHEVHAWARQERNLVSLPGVHFQAVDVRTDELPVDSLPDVLDGLAYCPGSINLKPFRSLKETDFQADFEVNLLGAVRCLQAVQRRFKKSEQASVILFSTVAVQRGLSFHASIAAAKGAVEGLTRSLAAEWAPRIRVNAIAPGLTDTPLAEKLLNSEEKRKASADRHPLKRVGSAMEIAQLATYLLSPQAGFITGQIIGVDGGMSAI